MSLLVQPAHAGAMHGIVPAALLAISRNLAHSFRQLGVLGQPRAAAAEAAQMLEGAKLKQVACASVPSLTPSIGAPSARQASSTTLRPCFSATAMMATMFAG